MARPPKSLGATLLQAFLRGALSGLEKSIEAEKNRKEAQGKTRTDSGLASSNTENPLRVNYSKLAETVLSDKKAELERQEADKQHWDLYLKDPKYRENYLRNRQRQDAERERLWADQEATLRKIRELNALRRRQPMIIEEDCTTCDGRGHYYSRKRGLTVRCTDCGGKGRRRNRRY